MNEKSLSQHSVSLENRKLLTLTGVTSVECSDEKQVILKTSMGKLKISGSSLLIGKLNTDTGDLSLTGNINVLEYKELKNQDGFLSSIFK